MFLHNLTKFFLFFTRNSYLKPLFSARGITKGTQIEKQESTVVKEPKTPPPVVQKPKEVTKKVTQPRKGFLGRVFSRKRSLRMKK